MSNMSMLNLVLSALNAYFAYDSFQKGQKNMGWFSVFISAFCFVSAVI
jgi:hypothetical protein